MDWVGRSLSHADGQRVRIAYARVSQGIRVAQFVLRRPFTGIKFDVAERSTANSLRADVAHLSRLDPH